MKDKRDTNRVSVRKENVYTEENIIWNIKKADSKEMSANYVSEMGTLWLFKVTWQRQ